MAIENQVTFAEVGNPKRVTQLTENTDAAGAYFLTEKVGESAAKKTSYATVESAVKSKVQSEYLQTLSVTPASDKTMSEKLVVGELKKRDDKIVQLEQNENNIEYKVEGSHSTLSDALKLIPNNELCRQLGMSIKVGLKGILYNYRFNGENVSSPVFENPGNWNCESFTNASYLEGLKNKPVNISGYINNMGVLQTDASSICTDFIEINSDYRSIYLHIDSFIYNQDAGYICFYDQNKQPVGGVLDKVYLMGKDISINTLIIPSVIGISARYFRINIKYKGVDICKGNIFTVQANSSNIFDRALLLKKAELAEEVVNLNCLEEFSKRKCQMFDNLGDSISSLSKDWEYTWNSYIKEAYGVVNNSHSMSGGAWVKPNHYTTCIYEQAQNINPNTEKLVIFCGVNDALGDHTLGSYDEAISKTDESINPLVTTTTICDAVKKTLSFISDKLPTAPRYMMLPMDTDNPELNLKIEPIRVELRKFAKSYGYTVVENSTFTPPLRILKTEYWADYLHPSTKGGIFIGKKIYELIF